MANHRIYQYTSLARPLDLSATADRAVLYLLALAALLGAVVGFFEPGGAMGALQRAVVFALLLYGSWALARELDPDDLPVSFIGALLAMVAAIFVTAPGVLVVYVALALVRMVTRSSGLEPRRSDSIVLMVLSIGVIYATASPLFGLVAALAFMLDGSLKAPLRSQWAYGLVCLGGMIVYMVDHDMGWPIMHWPRSLFEWLSLLFILIFALDSQRLNRVRTRGDVNGMRLDPARVRAGMAVGFLAALQGLNRPQEVVIIVSVIAAICLGMAFRKGFKAPVA